MKKAFIVVKGITQLIGNLSPLQQERISRLTERLEPYTAGGSVHILTPSLAVIGSADFVARGLAQVRSRFDESLWTDDRLDIRRAFEAMKSYAADSSILVVPQASGVISFAAGEFGVSSLLPTSPPADFIEDGEAIVFSLSEQKRVAFVTSFPCSAPAAH